MKPCTFLPRYVCLILVTLAAILLFPGRATATTEQTVYSFNPLKAGSLPDGGLVADATGNLYGVAANGGAFGAGTVFEFSPNDEGGWDQKILYNFTAGNDGGDPEGGVILDSAGNLYGMTTYGGLAGNGTVFELLRSPNGTWSENVLQDIDRGVYTRFVYGLVFDGEGNLYGTIATGGQFSGGVVFELSPTSSGPWKQKILYNFHSNSHYSGGSEPVGRLVVDQDGNLYGVTFVGGDGCFPGGCGVVYELSPTASGEWTETILHKFTGGSDGKYPDGGLLFDRVGNLYGTASEGGKVNADCYCGTVFKLAPNGNGEWAESTIYAFQGAFQGGSDGDSPYGSLSMDAAGDLYGVTTDGGGLGYCGNDGCGTVFEVSPNGSGEWSEQVLLRFNNATIGWNLSSSVYLDAEGQLFGETWGAPNSNDENGTLYALTPNSGQWNYTLVSNFSETDGSAPETALVADTKGNLYGTTFFGGTFDLGAVFELTPTTKGKWNEMMIYSFTEGHPVNGTIFPTAQPSTLIVDSAGNLYGEAVGGGSKNDGMVYKLSPMPDGSWQETTLYSFPGGVGGNSPSGGLVMDTSGNLYGTTQYGGQGTMQGQRPTGYGLVFELSPGADGTWSEKTLYQFAGYPSDGSQSLASLILDSSGNFYGTTSQGGDGSCTNTKGAPTGCGIVFELSPQNGSWHETILHSFLGGTQDGQFPYAGLLLDGSGNLFGTTISGGSGYSQIYASGTVYELSPDQGAGWKESLLVQFPSSDQQSIPYGNLISDAAGNLYSTTAGNGGAVFKLSPNSAGGWDYSELYAFGTGSPEAGVIFGTYGDLYGTAVFGGSSNSGFVFSITP
jgi:uncharacterized repeat protein (TIGR03803 family)